MIQIEKVVPLPEYLLEIRLNNGNSIMLNLQGRLGTARFGMLSDKELFQRASTSTDGCYIRWDNRVEISINEIFELARK